MKAVEFLREAAARMDDRAKEYDSPEGERSMAAIVTAFNAITGHNVGEAEGWLFMECLKNVRLFAAKGFHKDSAEDGIAYAALKSEAMEAAGAKHALIAKNDPNGPQPHWYRGIQSPQPGEA